MAALFIENLFSAAATDTSSTVASSGSTPPTTVADTDSQHSDILKQDVGEAADTGDVIMVAADAADAPAAPVDAPQQPDDSSPPASRRPRRARASEPVYNLSKLSATSNQGKRRADGDSTADGARRAMSGDTLVGSVFSGARARSKAGSDMNWSPGSLNSPRTRRQARLSPHVNRTSARRSGAGVSSLSSTLSAIRKRGKKAMKDGIEKMTRELRRLQDTNEFAGVEEKPILHTVWSNGKYVDPNAPPPSPPKKAKTVKEDGHDGKQDVEPELITNTKQRRVKKYLDKGLYAGQDMPFDIYKGLTPSEKKKLAQLPELIPSGHVNKAMPSPIYTGLRMLVAGRDFKLPFSVCSPLPKGQPKPDEWRKMTKSENPTALHFPTVANLSRPLHWLIQRILAQSATPAGPVQVHLQAGGWLR